MRAGPTSLVRGGRSSATAHNVRTSHCLEQCMSMIYPLLRTCLHVVAEPWLGRRIVQSPTTLPQAEKQGRKGKGGTKKGKKKIQSRLLRTPYRGDTVTWYINRE